jgi:hypothetical protein
MGNFVFGLILNLKEPAYGSGIIHYPRPLNEYSLPSYMHFGGHLPPKNLDKKGFLKNEKIMVQALYLFFSFGLSQSCRSRALTYSERSRLLSRCYVM